MPEGKSDRHCINCTLEHETERAWLINDGTGTHWIPKSQAEIYEKRSDGTIDMFVEEWILKEKGLI